MPSVSSLHSPDSLTEKAADLIRSAILSGALPPDSKLRIQALSEQFGLSATPVREALTRLVSSGLVQAIEQRGFRVAPLSLDDLADIQRVRQLVETEAFRLSIERGDAAWEARVVDALDALGRFPSGEGGALPEGHSDFDLAHKQFHAALLSACGSPRLIALHDELHDQIYRYRIALRLKPRRIEASVFDHQALAQMAISRNAGMAVESLRQHIHMTERASRQVAEESSASGVLLAPATPPGQRKR